MPHPVILRKLRIIALSAAIILCTLVQGCGSLDSEDFSNYTNELFREEVSSDTLTLHYTLEDPLNYGISDYDISLGGCTSSDKKASKNGLKSLKKQLARFRHTDLSAEDSLTYDTLCDYVDTQLALADYPLYEDPLLPSGGDASQLPLLFAQFPLHDTGDITDYLNLLTLTDNYLDGLLEFERERTEAGFFMSDKQCGEVLDGLEDFISDPDNNYLITSFSNRIDSLGLPQETADAYLTQNRHIVTESILPAYRRLISGLNALMGSGRNNGGLCHLDHGREYYEALVHVYTGCPDSMDQLAERIENARAQSLAAASSLVTSDPAILEKCESVSIAYTDNTEMIHALTDAMLEDFPSPPEISCGIANVDPSMQQYLAPAFYITAPIDHYKDNTIYINTASEYSDIHYFTTLAHESLPGHLYQTVMSYDYGLAPVRSLLGYPGYSEGWATYVELLSYHYAGLADDVADLLMHNQAATISLYASSDLGIHYFGWDSEKMYEFWGSYGITDHKTVDEITDLILADPGNYLKYYVGYLNFLDLREKVQQQYGDSFSLKDFHETILRIGPTSFPLIEEYYDMYAAHSTHEETYSASAPQT